MHPGWKVMVDWYGSQSELAKRMGVSRGLPGWRISRGLPPSAEWAIRAEIQSHGAITAREIRPELWEEKA